MSLETKTDTAPAEDELARLLAAEQRLERLLSDARSEASRIVAAATTSAAAAERALEEELARAIEDLSARLRGEAAQQEGEIRAEADAQARRLDHVPADRVAAMAGRLIERMVTR